MTLRTLALYSCCLLLLSACGDHQKAPATAAPLADVTIRARVEGFLQGVHFQQGSRIKKDDLLYTLESQSYEEKVATWMSEVAEVNTMAAKNNGDRARMEPLVKINAVSQSGLDTSQANYDASLASNLRATRIQLIYTKISSPIDKIIGKTLVRAGDLVDKDPSPVILSTVSRVDTILVTFFITGTQCCEGHTLYL